MFMLLKMYQNLSIIILWNIYMNVWMYLVKYIDLERARNGFNWNHFFVYEFDIIAHGYGIFLWAIV